MKGKVYRIGVGDMYWRFYSHLGVGDMQAILATVPVLRFQNADGRVKLVMTNHVKYVSEEPSCLEPDDDYDRYIYLKTGAM
jgi:hypothetical protein